VYRSAYEFIRDHLGYRLYFDLNKTKITTTGNQINYDIQFRNVGFSAVVNPRPVYLVLIDETGAIAFKQQLNVNPKNWQPYDPALKDYKVLTHQMKGSTTVSGLTGNFKVGLWLPDPTPLLELNAKYAIRFANRNLVIWQDATKKYAVNVLGTVNF
jgi:hypothetical protein